MRDGDWVSCPSRRRLPQLCSHQCAECLYSPHETRRAQARDSQLPGPEPPAYEWPKAALALGVDRYQSVMPAMMIVMMWRVTSARPNWATASTIRIT